MYTVVEQEHLETGTTWSVVNEHGRVICWRWWQRDALYHAALLTFLGI